MGAYATAVLVDTPTVFYETAELSGTVAADASGNSHPGTYSGTGITYNQTAFGTGLTAVFSVTGNVVALTSPVTSYGTTFTFEFWSSNVTTSSALTAAPGLIGDNPTSGNKGLSLTYDGTTFAGAQVNFVLKIGTGAATTTLNLTNTASPIKMSLIHYWVLTYDGTTYSLYVDNVLWASVVSAAVPSWPATTFALAGINAGAGGASSGKFSNFALYTNNALNTTRIAAHYNAAGTPIARMSQEVIEVHVTGVPSARMSQIVAEVLISTTVNPTGIREHHVIDDEWIMGG